MSNMEENKVIRKWKEKLAILIKIRIRMVVEKNIGDYPCNFQYNGSTIDQIFILQPILNNNFEKNLSGYIIFIGFKQAYNTLNMHKLYEAFTELGHVYQIPINRAAIQVLTGNVEGRRRRIRLRTKDLAELRPRNWKRISGNKEKWRKICSEPMDHLGLGS